MKICSRADYCKQTRTGVIRVSKIIGNKPVEYCLTLYDVHKGVLKPTKCTFPTDELAKAHAALYGFQVHDWKSQYIDN